MQASRVSAEWTTGRYQGGSMAIAARPRIAELVKGDLVHRDVYTSEEIFRLEMRRIFASTWVFVAHETEVPNVGDFKTDAIAGQPIIVIRDEADTLSEILWIAEFGCRYMYSAKAPHRCGDSEAP